MVALGGCVVDWGVHGCSRGGVCGCSVGGMCGCSVGGHVWLLCGGACVVAPGGHAWLWGACMVAWGVCVVALGGHAWDTMTHGDTVNEQAVRILLECILFPNIFLKWAPCQNSLIDLIHLILGSNPPKNGDHKGYLSHM